MSAFLHQLRISLRLHFRNRMAIIYSYLFPTIFLIAFWVLYRHESVPLARHMGELLTVTALGGACFGLPTTMVSERERGVWRRYRLAPVSTGILLAGTVLARYVLLLIAGLLQVALAMAIGMPLPNHPFDLWLAFTFVAFALMGLGLVIATLADNVPAVQALGQCIFLPMLIIGGVAVQLASLPEWAQHVSAFFPGRYAVESMQASVTGPGLGPVRFAILALFLIGAAAFVAGVKLFRWDAQQRFIARGGKGWVGVALASWTAVGLLAEAQGRIGPRTISIESRVEPRYTLSRAESSASATENERAAADKPSPAPENERTAADKSPAPETGRATTDTSSSTPDKERATEETSSPAPKEKPATEEQPSREPENERATEKRSASVPESGRAAEDKPSPAPGSNRGTADKPGPEPESKRGTPEGEGERAAPDAKEGSKEKPSNTAASERAAEKPAAKSETPPSGSDMPPEPEAWQEVTPAHIDLVVFERLPPDAGVVAPIAPASEPLDPDIEEEVEEVRSRLPSWPFAQVADPVQRARNVLYIAAVPDVFQLPVERYLPHVVFERLREDIPQEDLVKILFWIATHPNGGDDSAVDNLRDVGLRVSGPSDIQQARERVMIYALKLLGRITGRIPEQ